MELYPLSYKEREGFLFSFFKWLILSATDTALLGRWLRLDEVESCDRPGKRNTKECIQVLRTQHQV